MGRRREQERRVNVAERLSIRTLLLAVLRAHACCLPVDSILRSLANTVRRLSTRLLTIEGVNTL